MPLALAVARSCAVLARAWHGVAELLEARRNRRAVRRLAACDDRMLKDIGLSRAQVMGALEARYDVDPSLLLQQCRWRRPRAAPPQPR